MNAGKGQSVALGKFYTVHSINLCEYQISEEREIAASIISHAHQIPEHSALGILNVSRNKIIIIIMTVILF